MLDLLETLRLCVAAQAKEPGNPGTDAELDALLDDRIFAIIEVLIERYDECGELARACIARAARSHP